MMTVSVIPTDLCIRGIDVEFKALFQESWMMPPLVAKMIADIDQTQQIAPRVYESPVLGQITPYDLSGGVKGLIMILSCSEAREFSSVIFGENCVPWLCQLSFMTDFTLVMSHSLEMYGDIPVDAKTAEGTHLSVAEEVWSYYDSKIS